LRLKGFDIWKIEKNLSLFPRILHCFTIEMVFRSVSDRFGRRLGKGL
jgi:hypothetical protein